MYKVFKKYNDPDSEDDWIPTYFIISELKQHKGDLYYEQWGVAKKMVYYDVWPVAGKNHQDTFKHDCYLVYMTESLKDAMAMLEEKLNKCGIFSMFVRNWEDK